MLGVVVLALAAIPLVFDAVTSRCSPEGASLVVGLHPTLLDVRHDIGSYLNAPAAFDHIEIQPWGYDDPADLLSTGCRNGYQWVVWMGPEGADSLWAILYSTAPDVQRVVESRPLPPDGEGARSSALESLSSSMLLRIFRGQGMSGIDYFHDATPEAIRNYIQGEALFRRSNFHQATELFGYVVEEDPSSAYGWYRLANAQAWDVGQLTAWGAIGRAMELADALQPADRDLVRAVHEHYQQEYGFLEAFENVTTGSAEANLQRGDALFHLARMHAMDPLEAVPYFEKAIRLDPGLTPARLHLIDTAILARDGARAREHYHAYSQRASGSIPWLRAKYALDLVFGDEDTRGRALAAIDSAKARLPFSVPYLAQEYLGDPDLLPLQERLLVSDARLDSEESFPESKEVRGARRLLVYNYLNQGRLEDAAGVMALLGPEDRVFRKLIRYSVRLWGMSWPDPDPASRIDPDDPVDLFYTAAITLEGGRFQPYDALEEYFLRLAAEDPDVALWKRALDARRSWMEGDNSAIEVLGAVVIHPDILTYFGTHVTMRWWLAEMAWQSGEWSEAEKWYRSMPENPWARCRHALARRRVQGEETPKPTEVCATADVAPTGSPTDGRPTSTNGAQ